MDSWSAGLSQSQLICIFTALSLTLNVPISTKVFYFSLLLKCLRSLYGKQCGPRSDCSCSRSMLFASILNSSVVLGNYLQQTTSANDILRTIFFLALKGLNKGKEFIIPCHKIFSMQTIHKSCAITQLKFMKNSNAVVSSFIAHTQFSSS